MRKGSIARKTHYAEMVATKAVGMPALRSWAQTQRFGLGGIAAAALIAALILWVVVDKGGSATSQTPATTVTASSAAQLERLVTSIGHWIFWVGPKEGYTYELSRLSDGSVKIRYLPPGVKAGDTNSYLTVGTYPFIGAFGSLQGVAKQNGSTGLYVPGGGVAAFATNYPNDVHVAYPGVDYQLEVFDPTPGSATALVTSGRLAPVGDSRSTSTTSTAVSPTELKALSAALGQPIYWVGPKEGYTYELTRRPSGEIDVRYLPSGVAVGDPQPYLTIATYPFPGALQALRALAGQENELAIKVPGGGLAVLDRRHPTSIHLAYASVDSQVEIYSPSPTAVRRLVTSGRVRPVH